MHFSVEVKRWKTRSFIHPHNVRGKNKSRRRKANGLAGEQEQQEQDQSPRPKPAHLPFLLHLLRGTETRGGSGGSTLSVQGLCSRTSAFPSRSTPGSWGSPHRGMKRVAQDCREDAAFNNWRPHSALSASF